VTLGSSSISQIFYRLPLAAIVFSFVAFPSLALGAVLTQGYVSDQPLSIGSIVSIDPTASNKVVASTIKTVDNIFGVVVNNDNSVLTLSSNKKNQVQVATGGSVDVLVTSIAGDVRAGDQITASPIAGVGMKAITNVKVIGVAQADLAQSPGKTTQTFTDKNGQKQQAQLGQIPVLVNVAYYFKQPEKTIIPNVIQNIANTVANKKVSPLPILISLAVFIMTIISIISLVYAAIRSSIISVGRNPLSQSAVYRSLIQVFALVIAVLGVALTVIYLILSRI
jgi:hypothetical protein